MEKIIRSFRNASSISSQNLIKLFRGKTDTKELLANTSIIKKMKIGMSYLTEENKPNLLNNMIGSEYTHTSIYFGVELPLNKKTGIIVQYGNYNYTDKDESGNKINNIGFPYGKKGGLMFGEMDEKTFEDHYCTFGNINCILGKNFPKTTFKNFLEEVKKNNGPWDLNSYHPLNKSCHDFVVAAIKVIKPGFSEQFVTIKAENNQIPVIINNELKKRVVFIDC